MNRRPLLSASFLLVAFSTPGFSQDVIHTYSVPGWTGTFSVDVCSLGDLDGDGLAEVAISQVPIFGVASQAKVGVLHGGDGTLMQEYSEPAAADWFGFSLTKLADLNNDGTAELLIGAPGDPASSSAPTYAEVRTGSGGLHFTLSGPAGSSFGAASAALDDVNGDGVPDFAIGAPRDSSAGNNAGMIYIFSGQSGLQLFTITNSLATELLGQSLAAMPDQNGDGIGELLVGAPGTNKAFIYSGSNGTLLRTFAGPTGSRAFGYSVDVIGDLDGDAFADVIIGDPLIDGNSGSSEGVARVYSNSSSSVIYQHFGGFAGDHMGHRVTGVSDLNGDGFEDYLVGAPLLTSGSFNPAGFVQAHSGADGSVLFSVWGTPGVSACGFAMDTIGDFDGDGLVDLVIASPSANVALVVRAGEYIGTRFCFGAAGAMNCPCGNPNDGSVAGGEAGCANGTNSGGGTLSAVGSTSVTSANLSLVASGLVPSSTGLFFQGTQQVNGGLGQVFGDGLRCVSGPVKRLQIVASSATGTSATTVDIAVAGVVNAGETRDYQLWYRDAAGTLCGSGFNLTNGLELTWTP
ncbi:MAG: hypothetical protein ACI9F9_000329 [Candidatus Paceibacteria bacterium]|jgi:hypothetical protein